MQADSLIGAIPMRSTKHERECKVAERHASQACPSECEFRRVHHTTNREQPARQTAFQAVVMGSTPMRFTNFVTPL